MKKIYFLFMTAVMAFAMSSCSDDWKGIDGSDGEGQVSLKSMGVEVSNAESVVSRGAIDLSPFIITITNGTGAEVAAWIYAEMPEVFTLPVGEYTINVASREVEKAAWDAPLYKGSKSFTITDGDITDIGVVLCEFANIRVSIQYTDALRERLGDDIEVTVVANDEGRLVFTPSETRSGYFEALEGSTTLVARFEGTLKGESEKIVLTRPFTNVKGGMHYIITFSLNGPGIIPDETGGVTLSDGLTLDTTITEVDVNGNANVEEDILDGERPGQEEPENPGEDPGTDPGQEDAIIVTSETLSFDKPNSPSVTPALVNIKAAAGIAHLVVNISSDNDEFMSSAGSMLPLTFDLAYPPKKDESSTWAADIASLGLPVEGDVIDKTDLDFDITTLAPLLAGFPGTHTFTLTITDNNNVQVCKTLVFVAQ